jgi:hypothetical protein
MANLTASPDHAELRVLTPQEERLIKTLRLLQQIEPTAADQVEQFLWSLVSRYLTWSYSDPASLDRAMEFAGLDPFLRREVEILNEEFRCTEADGLEDY